MSVATNYAGILRNVTLGQAGSFIGFMTLAASLFLVAFELKQARDIAEIELTTQRLDIYNKVNGLYDLDHRLRKEEVIRKLLKEGLEALSPAEVSVAWITVEGIFSLDKLSYDTFRKGLQSAESMEGKFWRLARLTCDFPTISKELLADDEFGLEIKKRAATIDCSQLPHLFLDERMQDR